MGYGGPLEGERAEVSSFPRVGLGRAGVLVWSCLFALRGGGAGSLGCLPSSSRSTAVGRCLSLRHRPCPPMFGPQPSISDPSSERPRAADSGLSRATSYVLGTACQRYLPSQQRSQMKALPAFVQGLAANLAHCAVKIPTDVGNEHSPLVWHEGEFITFQDVQSAEPRQALEPGGISDQISLEASW